MYKSPAAIAALALLPALGACKAEPLPEHPPIAVEVVRLRTGDAASTFRMSGDIHAKVETSLAFRVAGKVVERKVDVGDKVAAGALLARLDSQQQAADVAVAASGARAAASALERAALELGREKTLFERGATPKAALDAVEQQYASAASALARAKAALAIAEDALSFTELRASQPGVVTARSVEVGQVVQPTAPAFALADDGPRDAVFRVDETVALRITLGSPLTLTVVDAPDVRAEGKVREIAPTVDRDTASVRIKVELASAPAAMTLGAPVVGELTLAAPRTFTLPTAALFSDDHEAPAVWVVDEKTKAVTLRKIGVATYESQRLVVQSGLADGEIVVTRGANRLRPAQIVRFAAGSQS